MKRGPKVQPDTALRNQDMILADAWLKFVDNVKKKDARLHAIHQATGLSIGAVRKALRDKPSLGIELEIERMRAWARDGIPGPSTTLADFC